MTDEKKASLIEHLDRKPPKLVPATWSGWRTWFEWRLVGVDAGDQPTYETTYLGDGSARTGPDPVDTKHRCSCAQCVVTP